MLIQFVYLDEPALDQYVSAIEGGLTTSARKRVAKTGAGEAGLDVKVASAKGSRAREDEDERVVQDTPAAKFSRLLGAAAGDPEALGWVEVVDPDTDFRDIGVGAMVSWECDIYVPDMVRMLSRAGGAMDALNAISGLVPSAKTLGFNMDGIPELAEMQAMAGFISGMQVKTLIVGEDDATDWRVAGHLEGDVNHDRVEGRARVVGKVTRALAHGQWKPFATFPGMDLIPRAERRAMERKAPEAGKEEEYLHGPALMLDILAIYR